MLLGSLDRTDRRITIVGGGFAGMAAAFSLDRAGWEVTLLEREARLGGLLGTDREPWGLCERAAHSFLASPALLEIAREVGCELLPARPQARARWVHFPPPAGAARGRLRRVPIGALGLVGAAIAFLRAYFALADRRVAPEEQTLAAWCRRHLGARALDRLLAPFTRGIYGADPEDLLVAQAFPSLLVPRGHSLLSFALHRWRKRPPGPRPARPRMMAPRGGLGELALKLGEHLARRLGPRLRRGAPVARLADLEAIPNLLLSVDARAAAGLLADRDPALSRALADLPHAPLLSVSVGVRHVRSRPARGVGALAARPSAPGGPLGILFTSAAFEGRGEAGCATYTVIFGGSVAPEAWRWDDARVGRETAAALASWLGVFPEEIAGFRAARWERAVPVYGPGQLAVARAAAAPGSWCAARPGRALLANYTGGVSLRALAECALRCV